MRRVKQVLFIILVMIMSSCREKLIEIPDNQDDAITEKPDVPERPDVQEPAPDIRLTFNISVEQSNSVNCDDAALIDELHYALYSMDEQNISYVLSDDSTPIVTDVLPFSPDDDTLEICLAACATGEFVLILWAQSAREDDAEFYDLSDLRHIRIIDEPTVCNQEERAAYYRTHKFNLTSETYSEDLVLTRPHARINLGTFQQSLRRPDGALLRLDQSSVTLKGVSAEFITIDGIESPAATIFGRAGEAGEYTFEMNTIPDKSIEVNGISYPYLALNYFFVADDVDMDFVVVGTPSKSETEAAEEDPDSEEKPRQATFEGSFSGINIHQGYTLNLIGHFFGADGRYEYDFRLSAGGVDADGNIIIGDEDGDGLYDDEIDYGWSLGGDDSWTGGIIGGGDGMDPGPGLGDGDNDNDGSEDQQKEDVRIELPDAVTWEVYTREGLMMWAEEVRASSTNQRINLKLFEDIYLDEDELWIPVTVSHETNYYGSIDGQEHSIHNLTINSEGNNVGFLACTNQDDDIQVANLYFHNVSVVGGNNTGVIVGKGEGIYNCHVVSGTVQGNEKVGGILGSVIGTNDSAPRNCTNSASVSGSTMVGGIAGDENSGVHVHVYDCINYGNVSAIGDYVGGICGAKGNLYPERCENHGEVRGNDYVGGIAGRGYVVSCNNYGTVTGNNYVGGITGYDYATGCVNRGNVTGVTYVGGISGYLSGNFCTDSHNYGIVKGIDSVGGCAGFAKTNYAPTIKSHFNYGDVYGESNVGGIFGRFRSNSKGPSLVDSTNEGNVSGNNNVGGLLGHIYQGKLNLSGNSTTGIITGSTNVGQFVGLLGGNGGSIIDDGTNVAGGEVVIVDTPAE